MTPQELKYSVLGYAFTGKLCNTTDSIDFGNIKTIALSETPFDIPETWKWSTLGMCCEMYTGNSISESEKALKYAGLKTGYDYIATKDVNFNQEICYDNGVRIPNDEGFKVAHKNAVLMCIEGGSAGRKIGILDRDVCFGNKLCSFHVQGLDNKYLFYYLQSWLFKELFSENMTGIIGGVSIKKLKDIAIPIAPLTEQKRIVAKIEELLPYIDRYESAWTKLEDFNKLFPVDMQKSILQYAIQGKLVEQRPEEGAGEDLYQQIQKEKQRLIKEGKIKKEKPLPEITEDEKPFDIPESWRWVRLSSIGVTQTGNTPSKSHPEYTGKDVPFITPGDILNGNIAYDNQALSTLGKLVARVCCAGTVLQVCIGGSIGKAAITDREVTFNQQINSIFPIYSDSQYIFAVMTSQYFVVNMKESAGGTATPIINRGIWDTLLIPLPPLAEQKRIVAKLEEILPLCEKLKKRGNSHG